MRNFFLGLSYYPKAWAFINKHHLKRLVWGGAALNLIAFVAVGVLAVSYAGELADYLSGAIKLDEPEGTFQTFLHFVVQFLIYIIVILLYLKLYRYIVLIFFAPWLAYVAEKVQEIDQHVSVPFQLSKFVSDIWRGIAIASRNLVIELGITFILLFLSFVIPFLSPLFTVMIFITESYFIGFSMIDYRNEYFGLSGKNSRELIWKNKGLALGNGMFFNLMLFVPLLGVLVAPTWAVVAGGLAINQIDPRKDPHEGQEGVRKL